MVEPMAKRSPKLRIVELADGVTLICGDCSDAFERVGAVDHTITDPPYEATMHNAKQFARGKKVYKGSTRRIRTDGHTSPRPVTFNSIDGLRETVTAPIVAATGGWFIAFCTPEGIAPWRDAIEGTGAKYKRACFWIKPDGAPQFNGQGPSYAVEPFVSAWCGAGPSKWNGGGRANYFIHATRNTDREGTHETEKPLSLMTDLMVLFSNPGEIIFDPFMGSGTTGVAAVRSGRRFIGVEKDERFFDVAVKRISKTLRQPDFFVAVPKPKQTVFSL